MIKAENKKHLEKLINEVYRGNLVFDQIDVSNIEDFSNIFSTIVFNKKYGSIENWNVSNGKIFDEMFSECENIWFDFSKWDMTNAKSTVRMFQFCHDFEGKGLEKWNLKNVVDCALMFEECENFDCDVSNWDMSNAREFTGMFYGCEKFRGIGLEKWNIHINEEEYVYVKNNKILKHKVSFHEIFFGCERLDFDISNWKINIELDDDSSLFNGCNNFKGKGFDKFTLKLKTLDLSFGLFTNCHSLQILPNIITTKDNKINYNIITDCYSLNDNKETNFEISSKPLFKTPLNNIKFKNFNKVFKIIHKDILKKFKESDLQNSYPIENDQYIFTNRRYKVKKNNGKKILGFSNVKIIDSKVDPKNLRLCSFYKKNEEIKEKNYIFYRMKNHNSLSNSPNSICEKFNYDEKNFYFKKNIFLSKNYQNKYFCNK